MSYINEIVVEDPESGKGIQRKVTEDANDVATTNIYLDDIHSDDSPQKTTDQNHEIPKKLSLDLKTLKLIGGVFIKVSHFLCRINIK